jgi:hypothetical protein
MIDSVNLMVLTHTSSGKTGYFTMYRLLLLALSKGLNIVVPAKKSVPKNPVMVLVFPTNGVKEEMVSLTVYLIYLLKSHAGVQELEFKSHRLVELMINTNRLAEAHSHGSNLWELAHKHVTMLCLSPEQLTLKGFADLLEHKLFWNRFCALGVDKIHLLYHWGLSF